MEIRDKFFYLVSFFNKAFLAFKAWLLESFPTFFKFYRWFLGATIADKLAIPTFAIVVYSFFLTLETTERSYRNEMAIAELARTKEFYGLRLEHAMTLKKLECYADYSGKRLQLDPDKLHLVKSYTDQLKKRHEEDGKFLKKTYIDNPDDKYQIANTIYFDRLDVHMHYYDMFVDLKSQLSNDERIKLDSLCATHNNM